MTDGVTVASDFGSVQDALDAYTHGQVLIPALPNAAFYGGPIVLPNQNGGVFSGQGILTILVNTQESHTISVPADDWLIQNLWIDQRRSSGDWDAIHSAGAETRIHNVDIDLAPRYGLNLEGVRGQVLDCQILRADKGFCRIAGSLSTVTGLICLAGTGQVAGADFLILDGALNSVSACTLMNVPENGVGIRINGADNTVQATVQGGSPGAIAVLVNQNRNVVATTSNCSGADGVGCKIEHGRRANDISGRYQGGKYGIECLGQENTIRADASGSVAGLFIDGSQNYASGRFESENGKAVHLASGYRNYVDGLIDGDVVIDAHQTSLSGLVRGDVYINGNYNVVKAQVIGQIHDSGTGNLSD